MASPASAAAAGAGSSTAAATRWCGSPASASATSRPCLEELCGGDPQRLTGPMVTAAAEDGDLVARRAFASVGDWLGVGLANLVAGLRPRLVVVGGGVSAAGERLLEPGPQRVARSLVGAAHRVVPPMSVPGLARRPAWWAPRTWPAPWPPGRDVCL